MQTAPLVYRDRSRRPEAKAKAVAMRKARKAKPASRAFLRIAFGMEG